MWFKSVEALVNCKLCSYVEWGKTHTLEDSGGPEHCRQPERTPEPDWSWVFPAWNVWDVWCAPPREPTNRGAVQVRRPASVILDALCPLWTLGPPEPPERPTGFRGHGCSSRNWRWASEYCFGLNCCLTAGWAKAESMRCYTGVRNGGGAKKLICKMLKKNNLYYT